VVYVAAVVFAASSLRLSYNDTVHGEVLACDDYLQVS
jgi:hypothetical protein